MKWPKKSGIPSFVSSYYKPNRRLKNEKKKHKNVSNYILITLDYVCHFTCYSNYFNYIAILTKINYILADLFSSRKDRLSFQ